MDSRKTEFAELDNKKESLTIFALTVGISIAMATLHALASDRNSMPGNRSGQQLTSDSVHRQIMPLASSNHSPKISFVRKPLAAPDILSFHIPLGADHHLGLNASLAAEHDLGLNVSLAAEHELTLHRPVPAADHRSISSESRPLAAAQDES